MGKRGGAINVNTSLTAPVVEGEEKLSGIVEMKASDVSDIDPEIQIFDLYAVGYDDKKTTQPFVHQLNIDTGIGGAIQVWANVNDGALVNVMSTAKFNTIKHHLGYYKPSTRWLCMADGNIVKPKAVWEGRIEIGGVWVRSSFQVFESGGNWEFLLRKPLLTALHAIHKYTNDMLTIENNGLSAVLRNQVDIMTDTCNEAHQKGTRVWKKLMDLKGNEEMLPPGKSTQTLITVKISLTSQT